MNTQVLPLITFCIPHFNNPKLLKRCLDSLESNSVNFEIIVVDDCSTIDNYEQVKRIVKNWTRSKIRLFHNIRNRGVSFTKNRCYWHAHARWCCFLDCDDYFEAGGVDTLAGYLVTQDNPINLFHCSNEAAAHVNEVKILNLKDYASKGTGGEALTVVDKSVCKLHPYFSSLRGYEGLGLVRLADRLHCQIVLSDVTPRYYSDTSDIRLSSGKGLKARSIKLAFGHVIMLSRYGRYLTLRRKLKLSMLIVYYVLMHFSWKLQLS
jgi:glycosyltransferase involved in cell wall biosynthesis